MKTLLNGVNEVLKKTDVIDADGLFTTLTDSARQMFIDTAIQVINEFIDELYTGDISKPKQMRESTITLAASTKEYGLHSCLLMLRQEYHLIDETNNHTIYIQGEDGYHKIITGDMEQDDTGQPNFCALSPVNGRLVMDRTPTGDAIGRVYKYRYDRDLELTLATDCFPFNAAVFRAMVPGAAELWKFYERGEFSETIWNRSMSRAKKFLRLTPKRNSWLAPRGGGSVTDPMSNVGSVS